jgi:hypothetical protein
VIWLTLLACVASMAAGLLTGLAMFAARTAILRLCSTCVELPPWWLKLG